MGKYSVWWVRHDEQGEVLVVDREEGTEEALLQEGKREFLSQCGDEWDDSDGYYVIHEVV